jgi:hypothetical protein
MLHSDFCYIPRPYSLKPLASGICHLKEKLLNRAAKEVQDWERIAKLSIEGMQV